MFASETSKVQYGFLRPIVEDAIYIQLVGSTRTEIGVSSHRHDQPELLEASRAGSI